MKRKTQKKLRNKPLFTHDENIEFAKLKKYCSRIALFKSFVVLMKKQGAEDLDVIKTCNKKDIHIITHNTGDFKDPGDKTKIGIICIGIVDEDVWIPKFAKLLKHFTHHTHFYHKTILIHNTITITDRITKETHVL